MTPRPFLLQRRRAGRLTALGSTAAAILAVLALGTAPARAAGPAALQADKPEGFDVLLLPQSTLVDVYYGGRRVGSVMAKYSPGMIRFAQPSALLALIPKVVRANTLLDVLDGDLPTHADRACADESNGRCRRLEPETIGVVFDQATFRADVFVNPAYLSVDAPLVGRYLPTPKAGPSLAASLGGEVAGAQRSGADFNLQGRAVAAYKNAHLLADVSESSTIGARVEAIAAAVDHRGIRIQAGLLPSLPLDLIDQSHFYGVSVGSQLDTLVNRDQVMANPIPLYLPNRAQVDILRAGRLLSSRQYDAGNQLIDTSGLPEGSYAVVLRIREAGGYVHEETRSINKNSSVPPPGLPQWFFGAGVNARELTAGIPQASTPFVQGGYARRLSQGAAADVAAALIDGHALVELGFNYAAPNGLRLRAASMASSNDGYGLLVAASANLTPSSVLTLDARQGWGRVDGNWTSSQIASAANANTSLTTNSFLFAPALTGTQVSAAYNTTWRGARFGMLASYHVAPFSKASYAYGPSLDIPVHIAGVGLRLVANGTETEHGLQAYLGFKLLFNRGRATVIGDMGVSSMSANGARQTGPVSDVTASVNRADPRWGEATAAAGYNHAPNEDTVMVGGQLRNGAGDLNAQIAHDFSGAVADTRYSAGFVVGAAITPSHLAVGDPSGGESGVMVSVQGAPPGSDFEVLVNNAPRGVVHAGQTMPIMLPAYRIYSVRLAPRSANVLDFDTASREVSLYPGNIQALTWKAQKIVEVFGRVLDSNHVPVAEAIIHGARGPGLTDDNGYFQVEMVENGALWFELPRDRLCEVAVTGVATARDHLSIGTRQCVAIMFADKDKPAQPAPANVRKTVDVPTLPPPPQPILPMVRAAFDRIDLSLAGAPRLGRLELKPAHPGPSARASGARRRGVVEHRHRAALRHGHAHRGAGPWQTVRTAHRKPGPRAAWPAGHA
jgi:hypothetical protein